MIIVLVVNTTAPGFNPPANGGAFGPNWNCPYGPKGPGLICYYKKLPEQQPKPN
jgi:hypothetical protein